MSAEVFVSLWKLVRATNVLDIHTDQICSDHMLFMVRMSSVIANNFIAIHFFSCSISILASSFRMCDEWVCVRARE